MRNVVVTPHCSAAAPGVWRVVVEAFLENLERLERGERLCNQLASAALGY